MISEETKQFFQAVMGDDVVKDIAVSVDKVTVGHVSFSVVCTYFFLYGKQHVFLNELAIMEEDDYNSEGAALSLIESLVKTLCITRADLAKILRHLAYDGVYATTEQRTAGGGCLNLIHRVASMLGVESGSITGTWDHGHLLQVSNIIMSIVGTK